MITMLTEHGVRDGPSPCLYLVPVDLPFDLPPRRVVEGVCSRCGLMWCSWLSLFCPLRCALEGR